MWRIGRLHGGAAFIELEGGQFKTVDAARIKKFPPRFIAKQVGQNKLEISDKDYAILVGLERERGSRRTTRQVRELIRENGVESEPRFQAIIDDHFDHDVDNYTPEENDLLIMLEETPELVRSGTTTTSDPGTTGERSPDNDEEELPPTPIFTTSTAAEAAALMAPAAPTAPEGRTFTLRSYQSSVIRRATARCSRQHGTILIHSMGSGKTMSALGIAENMGLSNLVLVVTPKGLETSFRKDAVDLSIDIEGRYKFENYDRLQSILKLESNAENSRIVHELCQVIRNSVVVCDESHNLIKLIRNSVCANPDYLRQVLGAFRLSRKLVLLTGTPMTTGWGDVAALVNLAAGSYIAAGDDDRFGAQFAKVGLAQWIGGLRTLFSSIVSVFSRVTGLLGTAVQIGIQFDEWLSNYTGFTLGDAIKYVASAVARRGSLLLSTLFPFKSFQVTDDDDLKVFAELTRKSENIDGWISNILVGVMGGGDMAVANLDITKVFEAFRPYVSYFDVSQIEAKLLTSKDDEAALAAVKLNLLDFPKVRYHEDSIAPDSFQVRQYFLNSLKTGLIDSEDLALTGRIDAADYTGTSYESVDSPKVWESKMRVIGNLSQDCYVFETVQDTKTFELNGIRVASRKYTSRKKASAPARDLDDAMPAFACTKFMHAFNLIAQYRRKNNYIPVVYTNFDNYGFKTFAAFLSSMGYGYLMLHPDDPQEQRLDIEKLANTIIPTDNFLIDMENSPICVIIHPRITEGINFFYAPAIVCLEPIVGYGTQEQVYARVVRSLNASKRRAIDEDGGFDFVTGSDVVDSDGVSRRRVIKDVHQLCLGFQKVIYDVPAVLHRFGAVQLRLLIDFNEIKSDFDKFGRDSLKAAKWIALGSKRATLGALSRVLEVTAGAVISLWSSVRTDRRLEIIVGDAPAVEVDGNQSVTFRFSATPSADATVLANAELPSAVAENLDRFANLRVKTGIWGSTNDFLLRIRESLKIWWENFNKTLVEDPFAFMRNRFQNFGVFGSYADGNVLNMNTMQKQQFRGLQNSLANLEDDLVTCDVFDLATIQDPSAPVVDQCDAVVAFKRGYKDSRSEDGLTDPDVKDMCYVFNEHIALQIMNGSFAGSTAEAGLRRERVARAHSSVPVREVLGEAEEGAKPGFGFELFGGYGYARVKPPFHVV